MEKICTEKRLVKNSSKKSGSWNYGCVYFSFTFLFFKFSIVHTLKTKVKEVEF